MFPRIECVGSLCVSSDRTHGGPNLTMQRFHNLTIIHGPFSYLFVLTSIILALGMTRVLAGVGEMLQAGTRHRIYWVHALWVINPFVYLVVAWWIFYRWRTQQPWTFFLFVFVLISPTILCLASIVLFPPESALDEFVDSKVRYYANHRAFFIFFPASLRSMLLIRCLREFRIFLNSDRNISSVALSFLPD